ncbi:Na+/H+ antiporter NhaA [Erythrobacter sp. LQ02-29]|uniref:Na+/H+ antiporter NhaA n=1 Tax=unclassified Erythrobacter TaxID=2633097 RepID=UPI001BFCD185|nr:MULTISPECIES: Na+/H+ antiporter NhaA [unclassified Erythrobacter]MCP9222439.1 Na+/H+ antiporter NhaA [Erythrobacter sp. LQ02-29]QWC56268.1 Na+/H+ antiporter NhaA [Erythrobacter sp. 3-20A1M]
MVDPIPKPIVRALAPVRALFVGDASGGILLILVAAAAMAVANSPLSESYHALFHDYWFSPRVFKLNTLHLWVNDGLMAIFFFVVGLEVKREVVSGQLSDPAQRRLPVLAAACGMIVPALIFVAVVTAEGAHLVRGWAIPAATDIAFAMGVLGLLGNRVPSSLRLFLLTVAIVDDIGAVLVIAAFYNKGIDPMWLAISLAIFGVMIGMNRFGVKRMWPFLLFAVLLWAAVLFSGVHATIAGVMAALTVPLRTGDGQSMLERLEHNLAPWSAYLVVPVFGFANAGVDFSGLGLGALVDPLPIAIAAGLFLGKQIGIFGIIVAATKVGFAKKPENASWPEIWGVTILCGIGFTMSLFIGQLAFDGQTELIDEAKIGILGGSLISAIVGYVVLRMTTAHPEEDAGQATYPSSP